LCFLKIITIFSGFVMQTIHRSLKWSAIGLGGCVLSSIMAAPARADLFSTALNNPGDQLITRDTSTGLEWLDLSVSKDLSYQQVISGQNDLTTKLGFRYASLTEIQDLIKSADTYGRNQPGIGSVSPNEPYSPYAASAITKFLGVPLISSVSLQTGYSNIYFTAPMFGQPDPTTNRISTFALSYNDASGNISTFPFGLQPFNNAIDINGANPSNAPGNSLYSLLVRSTSTTIPPTQKTPEPTTGLALLLTAGLVGKGYKKRQSPLVK
jgi:hypothetical protein